MAKTASCIHKKYRTRNDVTRCVDCGQELAHQVTLLPDTRVSKRNYADALAKAETEATPKGSWPHCPAHPDVPLFWHPRGWGWVCTTEQKEGKASPQPYALAGAKSVTVDPKGLTPPDDVRARPNQKAQQEAEWARGLLSSSTTRQQHGWQVKGRKSSSAGSRPANPGAGRKGTARPRA